MKNYSVQPVTYDETKSWLLHRHYAKRMPPISYAFGLFDGADLIGIVTYGVPSSSPLRAGLCGTEMINRVLELNRLVCNSDQKNTASRLVGGSLRLLPTPSIVVSFADTEQGHIGYIYQATNFIYTGLSAKRTNWKIKGMEHLHGATIADKSRGQESRADYMRQTYGDDFYLQDRPRKHRYIYFIGTKRQKKEMLAKLRYPILPYPKGETRRYEVPETQERQLRLFA